MLLHRNIKSQTCVTCGKELPLSRFKFKIVEGERVYSDECKAHGVMKVLSMSTRKLNNKEVNAIRDAGVARERLRAITEQLSNRALAKQYGVSSCTIERVINGERYVMQHEDDVAKMPIDDLIEKYIRGL